MVRPDVKSLACLDVRVREPIMHPVLDVGVREPIMHPVLDVGVREPIMLAWLEQAANVVQAFLRVRKTRLVLEVIAANMNGGKLKDAHAWMRHDGRGGLEDVGR